MAPIPLFVLFSLTHLVLLSSSAEEKKFNSSCPPSFACGKLGSLQFPFKNKKNPECGVFTVDCSEDIPKIQLKEGGHWYHIDHISPGYSIVINEKAPPFYPDFHSCEMMESFSNFSLPHFLSYNNGLFRGKTATLYNCSHNLRISPPGDCQNTTCEKYDIFYKRDPQNIPFPFEKQCSTIQLPIPEDHYPHQGPPSTFLTFEVHVAPECYQCYYEEGKCESNTENQFYCPNAPTGHRKLRLGLGLGLGLGVPLVIILAFFIWRGKQKRAAASILSRNISDPYINLDQEVGSGYLGGVLVFSYKDLKEATNNFNDENELGDGGFGTVYHDCSSKVNWSLYTNSWSLFLGVDRNSHHLKCLGLGVPFLVLILVFFIWRRKQKRAASILSRSISDPYINSDLEEGSGYPGVLVFSYKDLQEATNNFHAEKELGDGGFGTVYHGKLKDGREVAVKRLYEHNYKRVEQFINEIEILTRLRHKNLVSLYGCTSRRCRELLLVYEYIPNGTVADHLHGDRAKTSPLSWPIRLSIAIETANALAYLHASDIVHRDVKTNNILLDDNFCVKVADFGLSRLFPNDVTHVSTAPQGTPGYVDPEYYQCYQLTSKSDVYSFGVVLVELISSMPAVDITRHRHEINLSNLAISKIKKRAYNELVDPSLGFDSDIQVKTMIIAVAELAFQCLQQDKEMRPSMDEVLEILKGIEIGNNETENEQRNEALDGSGLNMITVRPPPSPDCDEVGFLERMKQEQPPSPNTVTVNWPGSRSTTPNISG